MYAVHVIGVAVAYASIGLAIGCTQQRLGYVSLAWAVIPAVAAYTYGIISSRLEVLPLIGAFSAVLVAIAVSIALSSLTLRVRGHAYTLLSFAILLLWDTFIRNATPLTGGAFGISGVPGLALGALSKPGGLLALSSISLAVTVLFLLVEKNRMIMPAAALYARSPRLARHFGVNGPLITALYATFAGLILGSAGVALASYVGFVGAASFGIASSITMLSIGLAFQVSRIFFIMVVFAIIIGPEIFRIAGLSGTEASQLRVAASGIVLIWTGFMHLGNLSRNPGGSR